MRRMIIALFSVLTASLALCAVSLYTQHEALDAMKALCREASQSVRREAFDEAEAQTDRLRDLFQKKTPILEMLTSHDDLHEASLRIVNTRVALECGDKDDACQALAELYELLEHLWSHEKFSLANLY